MGQKMVRFGELRGTRSRQGASKEVHEAGRIRPSLGSNGGHVLSLYPLLWRSLLPAVLFNGQTPLGMSNTNAMKQLRGPKHEIWPVCDPRAAPPGEYGL
jgi:hypothetical protein